jgi:hypothetical protein
MRKSVLALMAVAAIAAFGWPVLAQTTIGATTGDVWYSWTPKPDKLPPYGKNQPVTRLPAVLAKHKGQARWSEQVILTKRYDTKWIQAQPGDKSVTQYYADDRIVWVVWGGQIRFTIEGQQPFVATKGLPGAGAAAGALFHGNHRQRAVAAVRGVHTGILPMSRKAIQARRSGR